MKYNVYHGRAVNSSEFSLKYVGRDEAIDQFGPGFYFTNVEHVAAGYAGSDGIVINADIIINNPISDSTDATETEIMFMIKNAPSIIPIFNTTDEDEQLEAFYDSPLSDFSEYPGAALDDAVSTYTGGPAYDAMMTIWRDFYKYNPGEFLINLIKLGYDGYIDDKGEQSVFVVYIPKNIKILNIVKSSTLTESIDNVKDYPIIREDLIDVSEYLMNTLYIEDDQFDPSEMSLIPRYITIDELDEIPRLLNAYDNSGDMKRINKIRENMDTSYPIYLYDGELIAGVHRAIAYYLEGVTDYILAYDVEYYGDTTDDRDNIYEVFSGFIKSLERGNTKTLIEAILEGYNVLIESNTLIESREVGKSLNEYNKFKYLNNVVIYRARDKNGKTFEPNDYVTLSPNFAIEHAESNHVYNDESQIVIRAKVNPSDVFEAGNPGEYFYKGPSIEGVIAYVTLGDNYDYETPDITRTDIQLPLTESSQSNTSSTITLYRGLESKFDPKHDLNNTDAPNGYSTWTDNPELARQYAGEDGYVYQIELPLSELGNDVVDADGDRTLYLDNGKRAGLHGVSGKEYLVYNYHDLFNVNSITQSDVNDESKSLYIHNDDMDDGRNIILYCGLGDKLDSMLSNLHQSGDPSDYSRWYVNPKAAKYNAGSDGYVYKIKLPLSELGDDVINDDGDRVLFYKGNDMRSYDGDISSDSYYVYNDHDNFNPNDITLVNEPIFESENNEVVGGKADGMTLSDIAKLHNVDISQILSEFKMGVKVEMEHTDDPEVAIEIAMDHLVEIPDYYTRLDDMESEALTESINRDNYVVVYRGFPEEYEGGDGYGSSNKYIWVSYDNDFSDEYGKLHAYLMPQDVDLLEVSSEESDELLEEFSDIVGDQISDEIFYEPNDEFIDLLQEKGYDGFENEENILICNKTILKPIPMPITEAFDYDNQSLIEAILEGYSVIYEKMESEAGIIEAGNPMRPSRPKLDLKNASHKTRVMFGILSAYRHMGEHARKKFEYYIPKGIDIAIYSLDELSEHSLITLKEMATKIRNWEKAIIAADKKKNKKPTKKEEKEMAEYYEQRDLENARDRWQSALERKRMIEDGEYDETEIQNMLDAEIIDEDGNPLDVENPDAIDLPEEEVEDEVDIEDGSGVADEEVPDDINEEIIEEMDEELDEPISGGIIDGGSISKSGNKHKKPGNVVERSLLRSGEGGSKIAGGVGDMMTGLRELKDSVTGKKTEYYNPKSKSDKVRGSDIHQRKSRGRIK